MLRELQSWIYNGQRPGQFQEFSRVQIWSIKGIAAELWSRLIRERISVINYRDLGKVLKHPKGSEIKTEGSNKEKGVY